MYLRICLYKAEVGGSIPPAPTSILFEPPRRQPQLRSGSYGLWHPLVLSNIPSRRDLARDGALYLPSRNAKALAAHVITTLQDPGSAAKRSQIEVDLAAPFSIDAMVSRYETSTAE
jgi:hypothetical protein